MPAEVPRALWRPAHPSNYGHSLRINYNLLVIHITSGRSRAEPVAEMWSKPDHGTSAHFVIDQDGTILQCVPLRFPAWHAHTANERSIGIEHCAREPGELTSSDPGLPPSRSQLQSSAWLVAYLLKAGGLLPTREFVKGHAEADPSTTHTSCPDGGPWPWDDYMSMVLDEFLQISDDTTV